MASTNTLKMTWLRSKAYPYNNATHINTAHLEYLRFKSSSTKTHFNAVLIDELVKLGYTTGNAQTRLRSFYKAKTGLSGTNFETLERAFFSNLTNDYV
jgi:hypothetical protein